MERSGGVTELLGQATAGDRAAHDRLWTLLEKELRKIARQLVRRRGGPLQPTEVVNEAYIRFAARERPGLETEIEFRRYATKVMKSVIGQAARRRAAAKRSGRFQRKSLTDHPLLTRSAEQEVIIHDALDRLRTINPDAADAVELSEFGGLTNDQIGQALGVSLTKAKELLAYGRTNLAEALEGAGW